MGGLVVLSAWRFVPQIEQRLLDEVKAAVAPIVSAPVTISMNGHEATIAGPVADGAERDALLGAVAGVPGVRTVTDRLVEPPPPPEEAPGESPDEQAPPISLARADEPEPAEPLPGQPFEPIAETAPTADERLSEPVPDAIDSDSVDDLIAESIAESTGESTGESIAEATPVDDEPFERQPDPLAEATLSDDAASELPPERPPEPVDEPIAEAALPVEETLPELPPEPVADTLRADQAEPALSADAPSGADAPLPSLSLAVVDEALMLGGRIGADQDLSELVEPALAAFDPSYLTNQIDTTVATSAADWLEPVAGLLPQLAELSDPSLDIVDRQLTLSGTAPTRDSHDRLINLAIDSFTDYTVVERVDVDTTVDVPDPLAARPADPLPPSGQPLPGTGVDAPTAPVALTERDASSPLARSLAALDSERLTFESGSDVLTPNSSERLDELARLFLDHPDTVVEIEGHTDATGPAELNLSLSQKRASAVKRALTERGVDADRLIAYGYGEGVPLEDNSTAEGRARNRRIEFRF